MTRQPMIRRILCILLIGMLLFCMQPMDGFAGITTSDGITFEFKSLDKKYEYEVTSLDETAGTYNVVVPDWASNIAYGKMKYAGSETIKLIYDKKNKDGSSQKKDNTINLTNNVDKSMLFVLGTQGAGALQGNTIKATVDGQEKYTFNVKRKPTLSSLSISGHSEFTYNRKTETQELTIPFDEQEITLIPQYNAEYDPDSANPSVRLEVNDKVVSNGTEAKIVVGDLSWKEDNSANVDKATVKIELIPDKVTYPDTVDSVYTLTLIRPAASGKIAIQEQPKSAEYFDNETAKALNVSATDKSGMLNYQWYVSDTSDTTRGTAIEGADGETFTPEIQKIEGEETSITKYYYCKISAQDGSNEATTEAACIKTKKSPYPEVSLSMENGDPLPAGGFEFQVDQELSEKVKVTPAVPAGCEGGTYSKYSWFGVDQDGNQTTLELSKTETLDLSQTNTVEHDMSYVCEVTYTYEGKNFVTRSEPFRVLAYGAQKPQLSSKEPNDVYAVYVGNNVVLTFGTKGTLGQLYYQWFHSKDNMNFKPLTEDRLLLEQNTDITLETDIKNEPSEDYYYCKVTNVLTNSIKDGNSYEQSIKTKHIQVTTKAAETIEGVAGDGTKAHPFQLKDLTDLEKLRDKVNRDGATYYGSYFELTDNITLPANWTPIGIVSGTGMDEKKIEKVFSGNLDGQGKTITIAKGGKPLLNCARNTSVSNLNISGEQIDGYGLVDNYVVDRQVEKTIDITNVTIQTGTKILKSGFIGGYASGESIVNIVNCKIEDGVTIGYTKNESNIGAFAGEFNGSIINCESEADVYGVDIVGGIVANKGQSMGSFTVSNCDFKGTVTASGSHAGGICGSGYAGTNFGGFDSAPNTGCVTIKNCFSSGTISGKDYVGGILGSEASIGQCWSNRIGYIQDNLFTGTLESTGENVGGIVGYFRSLNKYTNIDNNYYLQTNNEPGIGGVKYIDTSKKISSPNASTVYFNTGNCANSTDTGQLGVQLGVPGLQRAKHNREDDPLGEDADKLAKAVSQDELKSGNVMELLNASESSFKNWVQGSSNPEHSSEAVAYKLTLSGDYKKNYFTGEKLDTSKLIVTAVYTDGSVKTVSSDNVEFSGFSSNTAGYRTITVKLKDGAAKATYDILVTYQAPEEITVYVTIYGDTAHGEGGTVHTLAAGNLTPWVKKTAYKVNQNTTAWSVLQEAFRDNGITWENPTGNYIESLTKDGQTLAEFTNGNLSGWMYTLNDTHPILGVSEQFLSNGDRILMHYSDDYTKEEGSDKWDVPVDTTQPVTQDVTATVNKDGEATSKVTSSDVDKLVDEAVKQSATTIEINVKDADKADKVTVELPKDSVKNIADKTDAALQVSTPHGNVVMDRKTMNEVVKAAEGNDIQIIVEKQTPLPELQKLLGTDISYTEVTVLSNGHEIKTFGTAKLKLILNVPDKIKDKKLMCAHVDENGKLEKMPGKLVTIDGKPFYQIETPHLSHFVVAEESVIDEIIKQQAEESDSEKLIGDVKATTIKLKSKLNKRSVKLTWTKSSDCEVDGYQIYRSTKKSAGYKKYATTKKLTYTNKAKLKKGTRYYYKVRGYRVIDGKTYYTQWSNKANRKMKANSVDYGVKKTTVKAKAAAMSGAVKVSWTKSKGYKVDGYQVYRSTKETKNFKKLGTTAKKSFKNTKSLKKGKTYYYKVRGYRVLDGKKVYTKWSKTISVKAK